MPGVGIFKVSYICYILMQLAKTLHPSYRGYSNVFVEYGFYFIE